MENSTRSTSSLTNAEIKRFSRQLIIPDFGIENQIKLKSKSALIVGCGGLGCPSALYLCTSGIGKIGFVDHDVVDESNIHRQIAHDLASVGKSKAHNLADKCKRLNDLATYEVHECLFEKSKALELCSSYDIVLDCSDNVPTRYLLNDVCVLLGKPLVSGSALKFEGQLTIYNHNEGPCYRCLYPRAPPANTVSNCSDSGILGPVVGVIGSMQALECIKVLCDLGTQLNNRMFVFDGLDFQTRLIKLRPNQAEKCLVCSAKHSTDQDKSKTFLDSFDYNFFCGVASADDKTPSLNLLDSAQRITCADYDELIQTGPMDRLLIDVRPECQFKICSLPNSMNIPFEKFENELESTIKDVKNLLDKMKENEQKSIFVVCRRGNDSQVVVELLNKHLKQSSVSVKDLIGGLAEWSKSVDSQFPIY